MSISTHVLVPYKDIEEDGINGNEEKEKRNTSTSGMDGEQGADEYECILGDTLLSREMLPWMHDDG